MYANAFGGDTILVQCDAERATCRRVHGDLIGSHLLPGDAIAGIGSMTLIANVAPGPDGATLFATGHRGNMYIDVGPGAVSTRRG